ncbi:MAG: hypothetical protein R3F54_16330 [Alphaproteobacteria bacterium]
MMDDALDQPLGPWNPGLSSSLPPAARSLATIYRPENIAGRLEDALERSAFTGLDPEDLVAFRPERLAVHELLIRVTGDFSVPDGKRYADLGINFRSIVDTILKRDIQPAMGEIVADFEALKCEMREAIDAELAHLQPHPPSPSPERSEPREQGGLLAWLGLKRPKEAPKAASADDRAGAPDMLSRWRRESLENPDPERRRLCRALTLVAGAISIKYGSIPHDTGVIAAIALDCVMNDHGSAVIGGMIEPLIARAVEREGYRLLPTQAEPVVMNVKGASAAGKSTLRPLQRQLAERLGIDWADFALISPDIWRKYLLDYDSLGEFWRYAGTLTGHELKIVDQKLDRYMADKARRGTIPHLLIDRFRFDSFAETEGGELGARLLTRFGSTVYMFFVITPPDATVERAWKRGLEFGRFKAVDDLLHHNVEAFTGMPDLFFTWALRKDKKVHYEFLDNSVPLGERPRTVAFGWNGAMTLLDIKSFLDVERYRRIDIDAASPEEVNPDADDMAPERNTAFLKRCAHDIAEITVADQESCRVIARIERGRLVWLDQGAFEQALTDPDQRAGLAVLAPETMRGQAIRAESPVYLDADEAATLGAYGPSGA